MIFPKKGSDETGALESYKALWDHVKWWEVTFPKFINPNIETESGSSANVNILKLEIEFSSYGKYG